VVGASQTHGTYLMPRMIAWVPPEVSDVAVQLQVHSTRRTSWSVAQWPGGSGDHRRELASSSTPCCRWFPTPTDDLPLVLRSSIRLVAPEPAGTKTTSNRLGFVCLDAQVRPTRKMWDHLLSRSGLGLQRLKIEMGASTP